MGSLAEALPNRIGSMIFCAECGTLLQVTESDDMVCDMCGTVEDARQYDNQPVVYHSREIALPSTLRTKRHVTDKRKEQKQEEALIKETCPKCKHDTASFATLQMRSADEGATVFYTCQKCSHKWSTQN